MTQGLTGFVNTSSATLQSSCHHTEYENVTQGGNFILATVPLFLQATYAGSVLSEVASVASSALSGVAQFFRVLFFPLISFPLSFFSTAVRGHFYERSLSLTAQPVTRYFRREEVQEEIKGTVTLSVGGRDCHYILGRNISWEVRRTVEVEGKRYWYRQLEDNEVFDSRCREIPIDGVQQRVRLEWEFCKNFVEMEVNGRKSYFELGSEVAAPVQGTIEVSELWQPIRTYRLTEILQEEPGCVKMQSQEMALYYDTGEEIDAPTETSYTFLIDGVPRHFASAKYVQSPSEGISGWLNKASNHFFGVSLLPTRLSRLSSKVLTLINEHASDFIRIALAVAGLALLYLGQMAMGLGVIAALSYEYLDHDLGVIPHSLSLFMEKWTPTASLVGLMIVGSPFWQFVAGTSLLLTIPSVQLFVHQQLATVLRKVGISILDQLTTYFEGRRLRSTDEFLERARALPNLEEIDAPLIERREMSHQEIEEILNGNDADYELNPASLSKNMEPLIDLPENRNYSLLAELWDRIGEEWTSPNLYRKLLKKLADDERFILFLQTRFPEAAPFHFEYDENNQAQTQAQQYAIARDRHILELEGLIQNLANERGVSKERFVAEWAKEQLQHFIHKLSGSEAIQGERGLLVHAMDNVAKIIPFLLAQEVDPSNLKDDLINLAIGGGNYCSLAMKRASEEVLDGHKGPLIEQRAAQLPPSERFEHDIKSAFQMARLQAIQGFYMMVTNHLRDSQYTQSTAADIHLYTAVSRMIKRGFYPMTQEEMEEFSTTELLFTETLLLPLRVELWGRFVERIPEGMRALAINRLNIMRNRSVDYLRHWAENNPRLNQGEKEALLNGAFAEDVIFEDPEMGDKLNRLMLMILGIYRKKAALVAVQ